MKQHFEALLQRDMSRKEFLSLIGYGVAAVIGLAELLRVVNGQRFYKQVHDINYSGGTYGGGEVVRH